MGKIGRLSRSRAHAGRGDELAGKLLQAAKLLEGAKGCELYVVNRTPDDPDTVWVTEVWTTREDLDASLQREGVPELIQEVLPLVDGAFDVIETTPVGGIGLVDARADVPPYTRVRLDEVEDLAAKFGYGELGTARFANTDLDARATGVSLQRLNPGRRQAFGHRHDQAEEVYVVLHGSGRVKLDDEVVEVAARDAIRVAPQVARAFEAGPDGLEVLAVGPRHAGDGDMLMGWWED
jgi:quinol monooxygenase YgiN/mannose-6-phosphate isomerase-like protein (cupin superfamily)